MRRISHHAEHRALFDQVKFSFIWPTAFIRGACFTASCYSIYLCVDGANCANSAYFHTIEVATLCVCRRMLLKLKSKLEILYKAQFSETLYLYSTSELTLRVPGPHFENHCCTHRVECLLRNSLTSILLSELVSSLPRSAVLIKELMSNKTNRKTKKTLRLWI